MFVIQIPAGRLSSCRIKLLSQRRGRESLQVDWLHVNMLLQRAALIPSPPHPPCPAEIQRSGPLGDDDLLFNCKHPNNICVYELMASRWTAGNRLIFSSTGRNVASASPCLPPWRRCNTRTSLVCPWVHHQDSVLQKGQSGTGAGLSVAALSSFTSDREAPPERRVHLGTESILYPSVGWGRPPSLPRLQEKPGISQILGSVSIWGESTVACEAPCEFWFGEQQRMFFQGGA